MPAPGEQHNVIANPFEEAKPRISEYTATEIATLQSRLEKQLGPEYISARSGPSGQKVHYIAAEKCIALANEVFGFNGWSSSIQNIQVDFVDENPQSFKISLGLSVIVRVTLRDGTFHEDIGYGHIENCKGKAAAFEKAKKEGTTDGLKRALRNFGNVLGNCIYDKDYLSKVTKLKVAPTKFDEVNLHRHVDYAPKAIKKEGNPESGKNAPTSLVHNDTLDSLDDDFGDFDMADFGVPDEETPDEVHPDEVVLPGSHGTSTKPSEKPQPISTGPGTGASRTSSNNPGPSKPMQPPARAPMTRSSSSGQLTAKPQPHTPQAASRPGAPIQTRPQMQQNNRPSGPVPAQVSAAQATANSRTSTPPPVSGNDQAPEGPVAFFSARSVTALPEGVPPGSLPQSGGKLFDPKLESPSIRKTPGIDHHSTKPVSKDKRHVAPLKQDEEPAARPSGGFNSANGSSRPSLGSVVNPSMNQMRQIGAPGSHSPMGNRGQYKPPTMMKRPADGGARTPLNEVTTNGTVGAGSVGADAKRQKVG
ncbi:DNA repair and recombination protein rhm52 [Seiridium cupressi]